MEEERGEDKGMGRGDKGEEGFKGEGRRIGQRQDICKINTKEVQSKSNSSFSQNFL